MTDGRAYWVWAQHAFGQGSYKPWHIYKRFAGGITEFYDGGAPVWDTLDFVTERESRSLHSFSLNEAEAVLEFCEKTGCKAITPESEKYPENLKNIFDPPAVLYYKGELPEHGSHPAVCVVGSRKAEKTVIDRTYDISYGLAAMDCTVISGGALGIDTAAHRGAMRGMGKTVLVLPCCLSSSYLVENYSLREKIADGFGALITEYPTEMSVGKGVFQIRNRIMSGLSDGVLIMQAALKSGTLITAKLAMEQNKDIFAYAGEPVSEGTAALIADGAKPVFSADDILCEYIHKFSVYGGKRLSETADLSGKIEELFPQEAAETGSLKSFAMADSMIDDADGLADEYTSEAKVLSVLTDEPQHISVLEERTGLLPGELLVTLTELELAGRIEAYSGRRYGLAKK